MSIYIKKKQVLIYLNDFNQRNLFSGYVLWLSCIHATIGYLLWMKNIMQFIRMVIFSISLLYSVGIFSLSSIVTKQKK